MDKEEALNTITGLLNLNCVEQNTECWRFAEQLIQTYEKFWDESVSAKPQVIPKIAEEIILKNLVQKVIDTFRKETGVKEQLNYRENKLIELTYLVLKNDSNFSE